VFVEVEDEGAYEGFDERFSFEVDEGQNEEENREEC